jgi:molybdenum cofactor cytidylyltransferase
MSALADALRLPRQPVIAFVGAGGKTTALFSVARALAPAVVTTTTHLAIPEAADADRHVVWAADDSLGSVGPIDDSGVVLLTGPPHEGTGRLSGLDAHQWVALRRWCSEHDRPLLVEADGSRRRPLKAPADHEPVIPPDVDAVVVMAGMLGCGLPLDDNHVHRAARFSTLSGCPAGALVTPDALAAALVHPDGGLKHIQPGVRRAVWLNQADTPELRAQAVGMAPLLRTAYDVVAIASLRDGWVELL